MSVNKVIVIGNLGANPDIRALPSGQNVANFSVATKARGNLRYQREYWRIFFDCLKQKCIQSCIDFHIAIPISFLFGRRCGAKRKAE